MSQARTPPLVLGSTSPYRRQLLERLGIPFSVCAPTCDEDALKDPTLSPQALAEHLAFAKAFSISSTQPETVVIGSDQVAAYQEGNEWHILGKPGTAEKAIAQLTALSGRSHVLITALVVNYGSHCSRHTDLTTLTMRNLSADALTRYVAADQPLNCAGAYKLEARGVTLFSHIQSDDHSAITGLPLLAVTRILSEIGFTIP